MTVAILTKRNRQLMRKAIVAALKGKTAAGDRVFASQSTPPWEDELPVILVYLRSESAEEYAVAPRELKRTLEIAIECIADGPETDQSIDGDMTFLDDTLDTMTKKVECELSRDDTLGSTADDIILTGTEFEFEGGGAKPIGSARLVYNVMYNTMVPEDAEKQAGLSPFKKINADWHVGHNDSAPDLTDVEANDDIDIPQI